MALNNDLQRFREEWCEELCSSRKVKEGEQQSLESDSYKKSKESKSWDNNELKQEHQPKDISTNESHLSVHSSSGMIDLKLIPSEDEDSQDPSSSFHITTKRNISTNANDADQYYPFKILTQFLNEAPHKIKNNRKRTKAEYNPNMTYSKKKYFDNLVQSESNAVHQHSDAEVGKEKEARSNDSKRMLDLFIADLDEINEIPFFDTSLPREVAIKIFQYLDLKALCTCSQVSRSWKSLADDELLWCNICHSLGFDTDSKIFEGRGWKERVQQHMNQRKALEVNWKARVGKPYQLNFARGGVLCGVAAHNSTIVAGYTNCQVKSWNSLTGDECTFNASNTSLMIDESTEDLGCIHNEIRHLSTTANITAASFSHGFVDVWKNEGVVDPIHTVTFGNRGVSDLCAHDISKYCSLVAASQQTRIQVTRIEDTEGRKLADVNMKSPVSKLLWMEGCHDRLSLVVSCSSSVWLKDFDIHSPVVEGITSQDELSMVEIHNLFYAPITCLGARSNLQEVGVGFNMITGSSSQPKLNMYDLNVRQAKASLNGHTWLISCMDLPSGIPHQLVTGSGDRKVRLFDLRCGTTPSMTMIGHGAKLMCIQMDEFKVVSGDEAGFVCVWDVRSGRKLWEIHNRHPVQYCHFEGRLLIVGNIPYNKFPESERDEFESVSSLRYRGKVQFYDFLADQQTQGVPEICLSSYNEPEAAFDYNLALAVPYDKL